MNIEINVAQYANYTIKRSICCQIHSFTSLQNVVPIRNFCEKFFPAPFIPVSVICYIIETGIVSVDVAREILREYFRKDLEDNKDFYDGNAHKIMKCFDSHNDKYEYLNPWMKIVIAAKTPSEISNAVTVCCTDGAITIDFLDNLLKNHNKEVCT